MSDKTIKITYKNKVYGIKTDILIYILKKLEGNTKIKIDGEKKIKELVKKFKLYDEYFLKSVSNMAEIDK